MSAAAPANAGRLTTHVLDTAGGRPAAGVRLALYRLGDSGREQVAEAVTNADGRCDAPLLDGADFTTGRYEIVFQIGDYFRAQRTSGGTSGQPYLDEVPVRFTVAAPGEHYHVPLLVSPYGYTTYRGS